MRSSGVVLRNTMGFSGIQGALTIKIPQGLVKL